MAWLQQFPVPGTNKTSKNHTAMDLQTADGLFHHLSSCCMAGGQYDPTEQSRHVIITA